MNIYERIAELEERMDELEELLAVEKDGEDISCYGIYVAVAWSDDFDIDYVDEVIDMIENDFEALFDYWGGTETSMTGVLYIWEEERKKLEGYVDKRGVYIRAISEPGERFHD